MTTQNTKLYRLGGNALIASGLFFLARSVLDWTVGPPPRIGSELGVWIAAGASRMAFANEALFFAAVCLIPAVPAMYHSLAAVDRNKALSGVGLLATLIPVLAMLDIVQGRLVFPMFGLQVNSPDVAAFAVTLFYGGLHATSLLFGVATIVLSLAMMRSTFGKGIAYFGFFTAACDFADSYAFILGPTIAIFSQCVFAVWFLVVGGRLRRLD